MTKAKRLPYALVTVSAAVLMLGSAAIPAGAHSPAADSDADTLRALAARQDLRIGTAVDSAALVGDPVYRSTLAHEFNSVTAENVMKWEAVEPQRGVHDWSRADDLVAFAKRNGQAVRGHTLLWHNQLPGWLTSGVADGSIDAAELRGIVREHITAQVRHFKGRVYQWDVVNEVFNDDGTLRDTIFLRLLGPGYIADAFRWAHAADPGTKLYLNDYNVEGINAKSTAYFELARQLRAERVPVHGFGIQGHLDIQYGFPGDVQANLERFARLGMQTSFTEVDVRMTLPVDDAKLARQAQDYRRLLQACLNVRRCTSFTVWGYTDKYSWVPGFFIGQGAANLLDEAFAPKPAYTAVRDELASRD